MKKWIIGLIFYLSLTSVSGAGYEVYDDKMYMLDYEVNSLVVMDGNLHLRGWAYIWDYQGFYEKNKSHFFTLRIKDHIYHDLNDYSIDLTHLNASNKLAYCTNKQNDSKGMSGICNYALKEIGFHFSIDLNELTTTYQEELSLILQVHTKNNHVFEAPLTYYGRLNKEVYDDVEIYFSHSLENASFIIDTSIDAFVKTGPSFSSSRATYKGEYLYLDPKSEFTHIIDRKVEEGVTWYKVGYAISTYKKGRLRIKEGNQYIAWIPSAYVKYSTNAYTLSFNHRPIIEANDLVLPLFSSFDPLKEIKVYDKEEGDLLNKVRVEGSVDTSKEGVYTLIYTIKDRLGFESVHERTITIKNEAPLLETKDRHLFLNETITKDLLLDDVKAYDQEDGNLIDHVSIDASHLDVSKVGSYPVYYSVKDRGNKEVSSKALFTIIDPYLNEPLKEYIRFISYDTLHTLEKTSIWLKDIDQLKSYFNKETPILTKTIHN